jgi:hypothetical protein
MGTRGLSFLDLGISQQRHSGFIPKSGQKAEKLTIRFSLFCRFEGGGMSVSSIEWKGSCGLQVLSMPR